MASEEVEFKIKGAASRSNSIASSAISSRRSSHVQEDRPESVPTDAAEQGNASSKGREAKKAEPSVEELKAKYRWFKCETVGADGNKCIYYLNAATNHSQWEEPNEPYWIYNVEIEDADLEAGLQNLRPSIAGVPDHYYGYIPSIHGNYDPTAPYAQYHKNIRAQEEASASQTNSVASGAAGYTSTMAFNRFTGNAQRAGLGPERHSDEAKSGRQMNAFFDADAAANSHGGVSLKAQRREVKLSKKEVQEMRQKKKEKKRKKQMAFLTS